MSSEEKKKRGKEEATLFGQVFIWEDKGTQASSCRTAWTRVDEKVKMNGGGGL